jgi:hypothetical protein
VSLRYLLLIKEKINRYTAFVANSINGRYMNSSFTPLYGNIPVCFVKGTLPLSLQNPFCPSHTHVIDLTDKYCIATSGIFEFHYKLRRSFKNGKSSGF